MPEKMSQQSNVCFYVLYKYIYVDILVRPDSCQFFQKYAFSANSESGNLGGNSKDSIEFCHFVKLRNNVILCLSITIFRSFCWITAQMDSLMSKITSFTLVFLQTDVLMSQLIHLCLVVYQEIVYFPQPEPVGVLAGGNPNWYPHNFLSCG